MVLKCPVGRSLGRIWATGCVKKQLGVYARYARNSFIFIFASFEAQQTFFSPIIKYWATFVAQMVKKPKKN